MICSIDKYLLGKTYLAIINFWGNRLRS